MRSDGDKRGDSKRPLREETRRCLLAAGASERRLAQRRRLEDAARNPITIDDPSGAVRRSGVLKRDRAIKRRRRAIAALSKLDWIDRELLPFSKPIARLRVDLAVELERFIRAQKALPTRAARAPERLPELQAAMAAAVIAGESPAAVAKFCAEKVVPHIPDATSDDDPNGADVARLLLDRIRKSGGSRRPSRKKS